MALDWTSAGGYELLVASLPWRGRALPLWALCCACKDLLTSRNHLEEGLIRAVTTALRAACPQLCLVWIADWGLARLSLFQFLAKLGVDFCIRVDTQLGLLGLPAGFYRAVLGRGKGSWLWLALQLLEQAKPSSWRQT